jgi:uncharacterized protein (DUF58 family)
MNWRWLLAATGILVFGLSLLELFEPGVSPLPDSQGLLSILAAAVLLYVSVLLVASSRRRLDRAETPDVERVAPPEIPGGDLERTVDGFPTVVDFDDDSPTVRDTLRNAAVAVLTRYRGLDPEQARQQVATGDWTDDPLAADLLGTDDLDPSLRERIRARLSAGSYEAYARARAVDAVASVAGVETDPETADSGLSASRETATTGRGPSDGGREPPRETHHWTGVSAVVLVCLGLGVLLESAGVVLAGTVAVGYATYARSTPLGVVELSVSREVSDTDPDPGDDIEVSVTVTNEGGFCPDLRIVDGVPESLAVTEGSPRRAVTLRGGESVTFSYTMAARQGTHEFEPTLVVARNLSNSTEQELLVDAETTVTAVPRPRPVQAPIPLRQQPTQYAGRAPTDSGGEGIEFHTVREYRPGDSMSRIDWNRRARTGELTTLEFRRERATRVVILVDVRPEARVGDALDSADAVERSVGAAQRIVPALLAEGHQAGIAAFGQQESYLAPDSGTSHSQRCRDLLATDPVFHERTGPDEQRRFWVRHLRRRLPDNTQLLLFSPLLDERAIRAVREFEAYGYPTTVISPDPTTTATSSHRLMRARRSLLMTDLRQAGVPVLDWAPSESLEEILEREVARG